MSPQFDFLDTLLERQLSAAVGKKVDFLTEAALSPYLCDAIKREVVIIYEE